jgi:hypothetical protein
VLGGIEALGDDPIDLGRRIGRQDGSIAIAGEPGRHVVDALLPAGEPLGVFGRNARLGMSVTGALAVVAPGEVIVSLRSAA